MKKRRVGMIMCCVLFLTALVCAGCGKSASKDKLTEIKEKGVLTVGTSADNEPWEYIDENDNFAGYDIELITEIAERMGVKAEITDMSFDALIAAVQNGKVDVAIASIGASEERKQAVDFTKTYHKEMNNVYVVRKDSGIQFTDKDEITGYKVGMQSGSLPDNYITSLIEEGKMDEKNVSRYESDEAVILDLAAGRIEVAAGDITTVEKFLEQYDIEVALRMAFYDLGENIAVQKNEDELTKELDNIIDEMYEDGYLDKLGEQWGIE